MLMDVITSPRGRHGAGRSGVVEQIVYYYLPSRASIWKFYIRKPSIVTWDTLILPIIFFMYGGILSLTFSHLYHYWHFHGGNVLGNHDNHHHKHMRIIIRDITRRHILFWQPDIGCGQGLCCCTALLFQSSPSLSSLSPSSSSSTSTHQCSWIALLPIPIIIMIN